MHYLFDGCVRQVLAGNLVDSEAVDNLTEHLAYRFVDPVILGHYESTRYFLADSQEPA